MDSCRTLIDRAEFFLRPSIDIRNFPREETLHIHPDIGRLSTAECYRRIRDCCTELGFDYILVGTTASTELSSQIAEHLMLAKPVEK